MKLTLPNRWETSSPIGPCSQATESHQRRPSSDGLFAVVSCMAASWRKSSRLEVSTQQTRIMGKAEHSLVGGFDRKRFAQQHDFVAELFQQIA